jgi:transposase
MSKRVVKKYTTEFKQSSARLAFTSDQPLSDTAKGLGVHVSTLHGWVQKYCSDTKQVNNLSESDMGRELKALKKELNQLRQERDILKKAAAYFASETL